MSNNWELMKNLALIKQAVRVVGAKTTDKGQYKNDFLSEKATWDVWYNAIDHVKKQFKDDFNADILFFIGDSTPIKASEFKEYYKEVQDYNKGGLVKNQKVLSLSTVKTEIKYVIIINGETMEGSFWALGEDDNDIAFANGKGITYHIRVFLQKLLGISSKGLEPELNDRGYGNHQKNKVDESLKSKIIDLISAKPDTYTKIQDAYFNKTNKILDIEALSEPELNKIYEAFNK